MHILIVTFQLNDLTEDAYAAYCAEMAPHFATLSGLISKIWLANSETQTYGGVYLWQSRADLEHYLTSETFRAIRDSPHFANVSACSFASLTEASAATAGPLANLATQIA